MDDGLVVGGQSPLDDPAAGKHDEPVLLGWFEQIQPPGRAGTGQILPQPRDTALSSLAR